MNTVEQRLSFNMKLNNFAKSLSYVKLFTMRSLLSQNITIGRLREQGIIVTTRDIVNEGLTIQEADYDFYRQNENVKFVDKQVPVYGIDNVAAEDVSRDLGSSI